MTGLYNYEFFKNYVEAEIIHAENISNLALIYISVDKLIEKSIEHGTEYAQKILQRLAYLILEKRDHNAAVFTVDYNLICLCLKNIQENKVFSFATEIRESVENSSVFAEPLTVSVGVLFMEQADMATYAMRCVRCYSKIKNSIKSGNGGNRVLNLRDSTKSEKSKRKVLIADNNTFHIEKLAGYFSDMEVECLACKDGIEALESIEKNIPDIIIAELNLPKMDGFTLCENLKRMTVEYSLIPFIMVSHKKNQETIVRANELKIKYYFKKPYFLLELKGLIRSLLEEKN